MAVNWLSSHKANTSITSLSSLRTRNRSSSLNRDSSNNPGPNNSSQSQLPLRISEPYLLSDDLTTVQPRPRRQLGFGAEVVSTPQDALERAFSPTPAAGTGSKLLKRDLPPIPQSPPVSTQLRSSKSSPHLKSPVRTSSAPPPPPMPLLSTADEGHSRTHRPASHGHTAAKPPIVNTTTTTPNPIPPLTPFATPPLGSVPANLPDHQHRSSVFSIPPAPVQPPFEAILLSSPQHHALHTKTIVTLETCTDTFRTTLGTLLSRPSALAAYLDGLKQQQQDEVPSSSDRSSRSSSNRDPASPFTRAFAEHLHSEGLHRLSYQSGGSGSPRVHIFLDRPSAPYAHVLGYLRSGSDSLPRSVQLGADAGKMDALLELRDEAVYLGMKDLVDVCEAEAKRAVGDIHLNVRTQSATPRPGIVAKTPSHSPSSSRPTSSEAGERPVHHKPRQLRHSPSATGLRPLAVPQSIHETVSSEGTVAGGESILETTAPWAEFAIRTSLDADDVPPVAGPPPSRALPETPKPLPAATTSRLAERATAGNAQQTQAHARSRSHPSPRIPVRPTLLGSPPPSKHVRAGSSFLPTMTSPTQTARSGATASSGSWI